MQYFACQKFVEMAPKDRFQELKNKGYCFQCLFPGAPQDKGKHHDGMCKKDFVHKLPLFNGNDVALSGIFGPDHSGVSLMSVKWAGRS